MAESKAEVVDDDDFELITSARQLAKPRPLRVEEVKVRDWPTANGKGAKFLEHELTGGEWVDMADSGWAKDKDGTRTVYDTKNEDFRFLAHTTRDPQRNRIWPTVEEAILELRALGKADLKTMVDAANKANAVKSVSAEKNSDETSTGS